MKRKKTIIKSIVLIILILILNLILSSKIWYYSSTSITTTNSNNNYNVIDNKENEQAEKAFYCFNYSEKRELTDIEDKTKNKLVTKVKNIIHDKNLKIIDLNNPAYIKKIAKDDIEYSEWKYNKRNMGFVFVYKQEAEISITNALIEKHYKTSDFDSIMLYDIEKSTVGTTSSFIGGKQKVKRSIIIKLTLKSNANIDKYGGFVNENGDNTLIIKIWIKNKIDEKDIKINITTNTQRASTINENSLTINNREHIVTKVTIFDHKGFSYLKNDDVIIELTISDPLIDFYTAHGKLPTDLKKMQFMPLSPWQIPSSSYLAKLVQLDQFSNYTFYDETKQLIGRWIEKGKEIKRISKYKYLFNKLNHYFLLFKDYLDNYKYYQFKWETL